MVAFYFIGMFFNFFLPTIVGGDAVKAILLSRETGAPARSTMSVFMERNVGLLALLTIATAAAFVAPTVEVKGFSLLHLALLLFAGFVAANVVLADRRAYHFVDYLVALTPLGRIRSRAASLYDAVVPYRDAALARRAGRRDRPVVPLPGRRDPRGILERQSARLRHPDLRAGRVRAPDFAGGHAARERERPRHPRGAVRAPARPDRGARRPSRSRSPCCTPS